MPSLRSSAAPVGVLPSRFKRRKLTLEDLKRPNGIPEVFHAFPEAFSTLSKGPGNELGDLRRLLELFQRWTSRFKPGVPFDDVVAELESLSGSNRIRAELRGMRQGILEKIAVESKRAGAGEDAAAAAGEGAGDRMGSGDDQGSSAAVVVAPPGVPAVAPSTAAAPAASETLALPPEDALDDDELEDLLRAPTTSQAVSQASGAGGRDREGETVAADRRGARASCDEDEDDELGIPEEEEAMFDELVGTGAEGVWGVPEAAFAPGRAPGLVADATASREEDLALPSDNDDEELAGEGRSGGRVAAADASDAAAPSDPAANGAAVGTGDEDDDLALPSDDDDDEDGAVERGWGKGKR